MYLFTRLATLRGSERRALGWAVEMTAYVNDHSDQPVTLWRTDFGAPVGTMAWSAWVESQDALARNFARLADDDGYFDMVDKGQEFVTAPPQDMLRQAITRRAHRGPAAGRVGNHRDHGRRRQRQVRRGRGLGRRDG